MFANKTARFIQLRWQPLLDYSQSPPAAVENVTYSVFTSFELKADLQSACVMNEDVYKANGYQKYNTRENSMELGLRPDANYKINVVAILTSGMDAGKVIPYS